MKKAIAFAAFAFMGLTTSMAHAQTTTSPALANQPQQTAPPASPSGQALGQPRTDGQPMTNARSQYKPERMRNAKKLMTDKKADRQELKMQKRADRTGSL